MARGNQGYVNVGALINPTEALSRSLTDLSNMYGKQAATKQAQEQAEADRLESDRRWDVQQQAQQKEQQYKDSLRGSKEATNRWLADIQQGNVKFSIDDYSAEMKKHFDNARKRIDTEDSAFRKYLTTGEEGDLQAATKVFEAGFGGNVDKSKITEAVNRRKQNLQALKLELGALTDPAERQKRLDTAMEGLFSERRSAIENEVSSGDSLLKKQKVASILRRMPKEVKAHADYDRLYNVIEKSLYGNTEKSLLDKERAAINAFNSQEKTRYNKESELFKEANKKYKVDYGTLTKLLKEDYGWSDNEDKKDIINVMLAKGISPDSIAFTVAQATNDGWLGKSLPAADSSEVLKLMAAAEARQNEVYGGNRAITPPKPMQLRSERSLAELQKSLLVGKASNSNFNNILEVAQEWRDKVKSRKPERLPDESSVGTPVPNSPKPTILPHPNTPGKDTHRNADVPEGGEFTPTKRFDRYGNPLPENFKLSGPQKLGVDFLDSLTSTVRGMTVPVINNMYSSISKATRSSSGFFDRRRRALHAIDKGLRETGGRVSTSPSRNVLTRPDLNMENTRLTAAGIKELQAETIGGNSKEAEKVVKQVEASIDMSDSGYKYTSVDKLPKSTLKAYIAALNRLKPKDGSIMDPQDYKEVTEAALLGHLDPA